MSVTLEQCILLRERHTLGRQHFSTALDCMRRSVFFVLLAQLPRPFAQAPCFSFGVWNFAGLTLSVYFHPTLEHVIHFILLQPVHFSTPSFPSSVCPTLACSTRTRLSWGQIFGCYTHSGLTTCGAEPGDQGKWLPQCMALKAPRRHLYPVAFLLVSSHLLVLWLILSLVILLAKYQ